VDNWYSFYAGRLDTGPGEVYRDSDWDNVAQAVDWIRGYRREEPFCVFLSLGYPHPPYGVEDPWYSSVDRGRVPPRVPTPGSWDRMPALMKGLVEGQGLRGWTESRWAELRATYLGMCGRIDHQLGLVVDALRARGVYDDTALFFFSDHGDYTGDYGIVEKAQNTFQDCLARVPFVIKPPARLGARAGVRDALVELVDFPATVEAIAGITPAHTHFGRSLVPVLRGETDGHRDAVFCEGGRLHGERHCMELESVENQEPHGLYYPRLALQRSEGPEHTKAVMCRTRTHKLVMRLYESDELYDLASDPRETDNRIDDPALAGVRQALAGRLARHYLETGDAVPHEPDRRTFA
jgi:arylsulfatase A-like enzyme